MNNGHIHQINLDEIEIHDIEFDTINGKDYEVFALAFCEDCGEENIEIYGISKFKEPTNNDVIWQLSNNYEIKE